MPPVSNRYEIVRPIASGGMATVYLGVARGAGGFERPVAIKVMHPGLAKDPNLVAMFLDEARVAANIRHTNVVATFDVASGEDGALCLVMEYVEGHSLRDISRVFRAEAARVPFDVGLRIVLDVLAGLHAAHQLTCPAGRPLGLIHRDISPHNILVSNDGIAKLTDFGIARSERRLGTTQAGQIKGKLAYMSIEQLRGQPLDQRTDIYGVGVVLWELLTGFRLFTGEHEGALALSVCNGATTAPHEVDPAVPVSVSLACMRALRENPEDRYPNAAAFADALEAAIVEAGIAVAPARAVSMLCAAVAQRREEPLPQSGENRHGPPLAIHSVSSLDDSRTRSLSELGLAPPPNDWEEQHTAATRTVQLKMPVSHPPPGPMDPFSGLIPPLPPNHRSTDSERAMAIACETRPRYSALTTSLKHRAMPVAAGAVGAAFALLLWFLSPGSANSDQTHTAAVGARPAVTAAVRGASTLLQTFKVQAATPAPVREPASTKAQAAPPPTSSPAEAKASDAPAAKSKASDAAEAKKAKASNAAEAKESAERTDTPARAPAGGRTKQATRRPSKPAQARSSKESPLNYRPSDL